MEETTVAETPVVDTPATETTAVEVAAGTEDQPANETPGVGSDQQITAPAEETTQDNSASENSTSETLEVKAPLNSQEVGDPQEADIIADEIVAANQPSFEDATVTDQQNVDDNDPTTKFSEIDQNVGSRKSQRDTGKIPGISEENQTSTSLPIA